MKLCDNDKRLVYDKDRCNEDLVYIFTVCVAFLGRSCNITVSRIQHQPFQPPLQPLFYNTLRELCGMEM